MRVWVDCGRTYLALCECGWRGDTRDSHAEASLEAAAHARRAHAGEKAAAKAATNRIRYTGARR